MKEYRGFIITFCVLISLYIVTELNKPQPVDWSMTLKKEDKIPYGGFILYQQLKDVFPGAELKSLRSPLYHQINDFNGDNTAYIIISPSFNPSAADMHEMKKYVSNGNYIFLSSNDFQKSFLDSFKLETSTRYSLVTKDSTSTNFVNPELKSVDNYTFFRSTLDQYFSKLDTGKTISLAVNNHKEPDFIKLKFGKGAFFVHANPACFSNYFILRGNNASYPSKALSYIPPHVSTIFWDEYYKAGREGADTPLRFFLSNEYLRWALRIALIGLVLYVLFQVKRKQRIIPVIEPLRNSTLDFITTVSGVYFNARDNTGIAGKKISYCLDFIRHKFNLPTQTLDEDFIEQLSRKSGIDKTSVEELVKLVSKVNSQNNISDGLLLHLSNTIDNFYKKV